MKAIILCAGKGERLKTLTENLPKPMIPINNKPLLEHMVLLCKKHNLTDIAINTSYLPERIKEYFGEGLKFGVKLRYSYEPNLLGTSGALNNFRYFFNETFFVIYGDNITDLNLTEMLDYHKKKKSLATLYLYEEPLVDKETTFGGVFIDETNRIRNIIEDINDFKKEDINNQDGNKKLTNAGIYILEPKILKLIPNGFSDFMKDIFPKAIKTDALYGFMSKCYLKEVGQIARYNQAKNDIESGRIKLNL